MNRIASTPEPVIRTIPLSRLDLAPENVRKTPADPAALAELKASIAAHGLLENLVVRAQGSGDHGAGRYAVIAGGRRLAAMRALVSEGVLDKDHPVPCLIAVNGDCGELSLAENVVRIAMHPADQVIAFYRLAESGVTISAIAARFGISERLVEQRLRLSRAAPELLDAYRAEEIDLETLKVFAVTTDHGRQRAVWEQVKDQGCRPGAWQVKRMLTEDSVPGAAAIARFVGIDAYEAAGGTITRDLFAQEDDRGIWFDDPVLLNKLAMQKLQDTADELDTRWKWAEAAPELDWSATARFGRIRPEPAEPTDEERAELQRLSARHDEFADMDDEDWTGDLIEEAEGIETRLDEIHAAVDARATFRPEDMAMAGCIATIGQDGALQVIQGLVRPEDMPKKAGKGADGLEADTGDSGAAELGRVDGPEISAPIASPPDPRAKAREEAGVGIGLADDLRAVRTALVKAHLAKDYEAAFDLMLFQLARAVFTNVHRADALDVAVKETADRPASRMNDEAFAGWSPGEAMLADRSGLSLDWMEQEDEGESFAALRALPQAEKQALFSAAVARTVKGQLAFEPDARPELEATIARLDIDFTAHVRPSADMLWSRIRKDRILAVARETLGPAWASARSKYKKADLAKAMEGAFAAGDPPVGLTASARAAALAWTPPGFAPFDTGRVEEPDRDVPPAGEPEPDPAPVPDTMEVVDDGVPDTVGGDASEASGPGVPADRDPGPETANGGPSIDVSQENVLTPPRTNGRDSGDGLDIPEFLRRA